MPRRAAARRVVLLRWLAHLRRHVQDRGGRDFASAEGGYIYTRLMSWEQMLCFFGRSFVAHVDLAVVVVVSATTVFLQGLC